MRKTGKFTIAKAFNIAITTLENLELGWVKYWQMTFVLPNLSKVSPAIILYDEAPFGTMTKCVDYAAVLIFKCPDLYTGFTVDNNEIN